MMNVWEPRLANVALALILGWVMWGVFSLALPAGWALLPGLGAGLAMVLWTRGNVIVSGAMALLEPVGVVIPILILRQMLGVLGVSFPAFSSGELVVFLVAYAGFLAASMGVIRFDPYRYGYAPVPVGAMVLVLCLYGALTGNWVIPLIAVAGQALWSFRMGSSNWFDHVLHVTLVPVAVVVLLLRLLA